MKKSFVFIVCLICALTLSLPVMAEENGYQKWELGTDIPTPSGIDFEVHDSCWEHSWFYQYHAREDGWYIVVSIVANLHGADEQKFDRMYIDIYNADGVFQKELSLSNSDDNTAVRLTENAVEIYRTNNYLSYNLTTGELTCHYAPNRYVKTSGLYDQLMQTKQKIGEWTYESSGLPSMYTSLVREKGGNTEKLLQLTGSSLHLPNILFYAAFVAVAIAVGFIIKKKRKAQK